MSKVFVEPEIDCVRITSEKITEGVLEPSYGVVPNPFPDDDAEGGF